MKIRYYPETDSLYIDLSKKTSTDSLQVAPGVVLDFDATGALVGIDIDHASKVVDLTRQETEALPLSSLSVVGAQSQTAQLPIANRPLDQ